jgi:hypothetical protein
MSSSSSYYSIFSTIDSSYENTGINEDIPPAPALLEEGPPVPVIKNEAWLESKLFYGPKPCFLSLGLYIIKELAFR